MGDMSFKEVKLFLLARTALLFSMWSGLVLVGVPNEKSISVTGPISAAV
jgi:hypothetical protein